LGWGATVGAPTIGCRFCWTFSDFSALWVKVLLSVEELLRRFDEEVILSVGWKELPLFIRIGVQYANEAGQNSNEFGFSRSFGELVPLAS